MAAAVDRRSKTYRRWKLKARYSGFPVPRAPYTIGPGCNISCDHCGKVAAVTLLRPAIMSRATAGDWVCAGCHPLSAMAVLTGLVV